MIYPTTMIERLLSVAESVSHSITGPCACHVVLPDPRADRQPWVEIRLSHSISVELEEQIEQTFPDIEFETVYCDEDYL